MTNDELATRSAADALEVMSTPIGGVRPISVLHRANAVRLLSAAFSALWEAATKQEGIAADLLTALEAALPHLDYEHVPNEVWFAVTAAVAKARGQS